MARKIIVGDQEFVVPDKLYDVCLPSLIKPSHKL